MSMWTYVRGLIELGVPGRTQAEKDYILQTVIDHLGLKLKINIFLFLMALCEIDVMRTHSKR